MRFEELPDLTARVYLQFHKYTARGAGCWLGVGPVLLTRLAHGLQAARQQLVVTTVALHVPLHMKNGKDRGIDWRQGYGYYHQSK